ncbi:MAG: hypothetical protein R6V23_03165 [Bacteroidales bacterium]
MKNKLNNNLKKLQENKENPFSVPEGYFETFPSRIQEKIVADQKEPGWILKLFYFAKPQLALGFMILGFALIAITVTDTIMTKQSKSPINSGIYTRIIEVDASEYSEQQFIDILLEDEKEIIENNEKETDQYIHYLMDENIDYGTLIDEL